MPSPPNLHDVGRGVFRSAQPTTADEWTSIAALGIRHVLKLNFPSEGTDQPARDLGLEVIELPIEPMQDPNLLTAIGDTFLEPPADTLARAVQMLMTAQPGDGWLVHCLHGNDRTGLVVAMLRCKRDGWTAVAAAEEALCRGFHPELAGLDRAWVRFVGTLP